MNEITRLHGQQSNENGLFSVLFYLVCVRVCLSVLAECSLWSRQCGVMISLIEFSVNTAQKRLYMKREFADSIDIFFRIIIFNRICLLGYFN